MTNKKKKRSLPFILIFLSIISSACSEKKDLSETQRMINKNDSLTDIIENQTLTIDSLQGFLKDKRNEISDGYPIFFGNKYKEIKDPRRHIEEALKGQPDLIPLEAVLGGEMKLRAAEVISEHWVLAIYDDGHIQGKSIFEYDLRPDGRVQFTLIASKE